MQPLREARECDSVRRLAIVFFLFFFFWSLPGAAQSLPSLDVVFLSFFFFPSFILRLHGWYLSALCEPPLLSFFFFSACSHAFCGLCGDLGNGFLRRESRSVRTRGPRGCFPSPCPSRGPQLLPLRTTSPSPQSTTSVTVTQSAAS